LPLLLLDALPSPVYQSTYDPSSVNTHAPTFILIRSYLSIPHPIPNPQTNQPTEQAVDARYARDPELDHNHTRPASSPSPTPPEGPHDHNNNNNHNHNNDELGTSVSSLGGSSSSSSLSTLRRPAPQYALPHPYDPFQTYFLGEVRGRARLGGLSGWMLMRGRKEERKEQGGWHAD
jgi:hypothetical protein